MEELYERPREKIQSRGAASLTNVELLQAILGSGSPKYSSAKLARKISKLATAQTLNYTSLIAIQGMGHAKVSQVLASIELGHRLKASLSASSENVISRDQEIRATLTRYPVVYCDFLDGGKRLVLSKSYRLPGKDMASVVREILAEALVKGIRYVAICFGSIKHPESASMNELGFVKNLVNAAANLSITINEIFIINEHQRYELRAVEYAQ